MARPTEAQIEAGRRKLRRQGMADAAVLLVARRFHPFATLDVLGDLLGLDVLEVQGAVRRFEARAHPNRPRPATDLLKPRTEGSTGGAAHGVTDAVAAYVRQHGTVTCSKGRVTSKIADALGLAPTAVTPALKRLETAGQLSRSTTGRRTYSVTWGAP